MKTKVVYHLVRYFFVVAALASVEAGAQTVEVTSTGVGIGTSTPARMLHVARNATDGVAGGTANSYEVAQFKVHGTGAIERGLEIGAPTGSITSPVYLKVHGTSNRFALLNETSTEQFTVLNSGNVGIGTTSPSAKLHVQGPDASSRTLVAKFLNPNSGNGAGAEILIGPVGDNYMASISSAGYPFSTYASDLWLRPRLSSSALGSGVYISSADYVGIGTTSPDARLTIDGGDNTAIRVKRSGVVSAYLGDPGSTDAGGLVLYDNSGNLTVLVDGASGGSTYFNTGGNFGFGTTTLTHKVTVAGSVRATSFISDTTTYADFVFKPGYKLASLSEVEAAIEKHGHLPGIPSEAEAKTNGVDLAAMQVKLLQKVEELTLHLIAHEKELQRLSNENATLQRKLSELNSRSP